MRTGLNVITLLLLFAASASADTLETVFFRANLSPANEVPAITTVTYSGRATIALHLRRNDAGAIVSGVVDFDIDYNFGVDAVTITGLHIHEAPAGVNGPIRIESGISNSNTLPAQGTGNIFRQVNVDGGAALTALGSILANPANFYVNLHTSVNPGGVMRDQMTRMEILVVRAILDPANEVPPITGLNARGAGSIFILATRNQSGMITGGTVRMDVTYSFPGEVTIRGLHIHPGAAGVNGPAVIDTGLSSSNTIADVDGSGSLTYEVDVPNPASTAQQQQQQLDVLRGVFSNPANAYLNIHTTVNTGGAMRGQLQPTTETSIQFPMSSEQENPPVQPPATGLAKVSVFVTRDEAGTVTSGTAVFDVNYTFPGSITIRGFHIHTGPTGVNGPVNIDSGLSGNNTLVDEDGIGNLYKIIDVGPADTRGGLDAIRSVLTTPENQYLNIHSTVNTGATFAGSWAEASCLSPRSPAAAS